MLDYIKSKLTNRNTPTLEKKLSNDEINIQLIRESGAFEVEWYFQKNPDIQAEGADPVAHYYFQGWREGRNPSYLFESSWYLERFPDVAASGLNPLIHYLQFGEREGRSPSPYFDPNFYRSQTPPAEGRLCLLGHYLQDGWKQYAPNEYFDGPHYLEKYPDIAATAVQPLRHYIRQGWWEGREINSVYSFDKYAKLLAERLGNPVQPLGYFLKVGRPNGEALPKIHEPAEVKTAVQTSSMLQTEVLKNQLPGPFFEEKLIGSALAAKSARARLFAFYLPQFHPFPENDLWWGKGFTEWRNVTRALPRFEGHQQPQLPRDLGFYDLRNVETIAEQVQIAQNAGISGFCFYYYWFNGTRLLDRPLNLFLENTDIDFPFSLMWANENWTRRWDGLENDVLMGQDYRPEDDAALVADLARYFKDARYERIDGRPLFTIYRPGIVPDFEKRLKSWRQLFKDEHDLEPLILMALGFGDHDPNLYGLDGAIEFPPHKLAQGLPMVNNQLNVIDPEFQGHYMSYDDLVASSLAVEPPNFELIRTLVPAWDNEARKPSRGMGFVGANPEKYENWLRQLVGQAIDRPFFGKQPYVLVNAWNEWAEGAHLEPDLYHGAAYLNATFRALTGVRKPLPSGNTILLVGHDAYLHGAQLLTLNIMRTLSKEFGLEVTLVLLDGGPLVDEYRKLGNVIIVSESDRTLAQLVDEIATAMPRKQAICNTVVTGNVVELLAQRGFSVVSLIHELSQLIFERNLEPRAEAVAQHADKVVFAAQFVRDSFEKITGPLGERARVQPQGIYQAVGYNPDLRSELRERLNLPETARIVFNLGFADLRKGFDLFLEVAKKVIAEDPDCHFVWMGNVQAELKHWFSVDLAHEPLKGNFHLLPFDYQVNTYLNGADVFALTSREDPFPSVVLEALASGLPVIAFAGGGGYVEAIECDRNNGAVVPMGDSDAMAAAVIAALGNTEQEKSARRAKDASERYNWREYVFSLLETLDPALKKVSVVVPNYNYAHYLPERLDSIFAQVYPIYELIILDDCSTDESVAIIEEHLTVAGRAATIVRNANNSGSVFKQWEKGVALAQGELVWIAEADDSCSANFLTDLVSRFTTKTKLGFSDSSQIDSKGGLLGSSYGFYFDDLLRNHMVADFSMPGQEFVESTLAIKNVILNVSAVVFERLSLLNVFERSRKEIYSYKVAGDWYVYVAMLAQQDTEVVYCHSPNNIHRRHAVSVTHALNNERHLAEIGKIQQFAAGKLRIPEEVSVAAEQYLDRISLQLRPGDIKLESTEDNK